MEKKKRNELEAVLDFSASEEHLEEGEDNLGSSPIRTCIAGRERKSKGDLIRFVLSPQNAVTPDIHSRLPGRGVWVTAEKSAVQEAVKRKGFQRAFKASQISVSGRLADEVEELLKRHAIERLSIVKKAGQILTGFTKVYEGLNQKAVIALVHAQEAAEDGRNKLWKKFAAVCGAQEHIAAINCLTSAEIGLATGGSNVIHAGLKEGGAAREFLKAIERFQHYRTVGNGIDPLRQGKE
jgi:predicted RNA-binding protein YlxR (DUF448 family)